MEFSLLWKKNDKEVSELNIELFNDLKIRKILEYNYDNYNETEEVIETMSKVPSVLSLKYRQEIFTDILNDQTGIVDSLYYSLVDLVDRFNSFKDATENIKRKVFYLMYEYYYYMFLELVCSRLKEMNVQSEGLRGLVSDIQDILQSKETINKREVINKFYANVTSHLNFNVEIHDGSPYYLMTFEKKENIEDELRRIASSLNTPLIKKPKLAIRKEINPYFIYEISLNDKAIYDKVQELYEINRNNVVDLSSFIKETRYYLSLKRLFLKVKSKGIEYCKGEINSVNNTIIKDAYDISLQVSNIEVIPNDFNANDIENIQFVLGVNSGGKTCYLRSVATNYVLFMTCGYLFAKEAKIFPVKYIHTHFPNEENYSHGEGRLRDEIKRLNIIKETFGEDCIAFLNETFSSTSEEKACVLTKELLNDIGTTRAKVMYVTHQYKIFEEIHDERIGFYTPVVLEDESNRRTHKIKKVEKKLLSYVGDILYKYGLTKNQLLERRGKKDE